MIRYCYALLFTVVLLTACSSTNTLNNTASSAIIPHLNLNLKGNSKIVFLTFDMILQDSIKDTYTFTLINKICSEGSIKKHLYNDEMSFEKNFLYIKLSNQEGKESSWIKVNDPLNMLYEYPSDENNNLGKSVIRNNKGILSFRFQSDSSFNFLSIYKQDSNLQLKKIYYATL